MKPPVLVKNQPPRALPPTSVGDRVALARFPEKHCAVLACLRRSPQGYLRAILAPGSGTDADAH